MKKLLSTNYSASAFNCALLLLRIGAGVLLAAHGYGKLIHFQEYSSQFVNFLGLGSSFSLALVVFAEFFCSIFVILGLFTRLACIPIIIAMAVAVAKGHNYDFFGKGEPASLFFLIFLTILLVGPGKASIDGAVNK
jgi:putative oxidoreductase